MGTSVNPQVAVLFDVNGNAHAVIDGVAIPVNTPSLLVAGHDDGALARVMRTAVDGTVRIDPTGTTIQPISNPNIDAPLSTLSTEATLFAFASAFVAEDFAQEATLLAFLAAFNAEDFATQTTLAALLAAFIAEDFATETTLLTRLSKADFEARINTQGQKLMAASTPVVLATDQAPVPITNIPYGSRTGISGGNRSLGGGTSGTLNAMRATTYTEPGAAAQRSIVSSNAADAAAGAGARTVEVVYYDNTGAGPFSETIVLNGVTPVNTVAVNIRFIEEMKVLTVGTVGGSNVGTITLFTGTGGGGTPIGTIGVGNIVAAVGDGQTLWAHHYVALGSVAQLSTFTCAAQAANAGTSARFALRKFMPLVANSIEGEIGSSLLIVGAFQRRLTFSTFVTGFARITAYVVPNVNNTNLQAAFDWAETP